MSQLLQRLFRFGKKDVPEDKPIGVFHRLQEYCALEICEHERMQRNLHGPAPRPDKASPKLARETLADLALEQTPVVVPEKGNPQTVKETQADLWLEHTPVVIPEASADAAAAPTWTQRVRSWFQTPSQLLDDRRIARRYALGQAHPHLKICVGSAEWPARVLDISTTGVGLVLGLQHRRGTSLQLTILDKSRAITWPVQALVVRLLLLPDGQWFTGCAFDKPLDDEGLKDLLERTSQIQRNRRKSL